jgi:hypothetical protein
MSSSGSLPASWGVQWITGARQMSVAEFLSSDLVDLVQRRASIRSFLLPPGAESGTTAVTGQPPPIILLPACADQGSSTSHTVSTAGWGLLQLQGMHNILEALPQRVQHQASRVEDEEDSGHVNSGAMSRRKRIAKLLLTDGLHGFVALERGGLEGCEALDSICFGAKIRVTAPTLPVRCGLVLLDPTSFFVVGGSVRRLQVHWDGVMKRLHKQLCGGPPQREDEAAPQALVVPYVTAIRAPAPAASTLQHDSTGGPAGSLRHDAPHHQPQKRERDEQQAAPHHLQQPPTMAPVAAVTATTSSEPLGRWLVIDGTLAEVRGNLNVVGGEFVLPVLFLVTNVIEGSPGDVGGGELEVDLGHRWMRVLLGMGCDEFIEISAGADAGNANAQAQLDEVVDRVSTFLESYGSGRLRLGYRARPIAVDEGVPHWVVVAQERH